MINVLFRLKGSTTTGNQGNISLTVFTDKGVILRLGERWLRLCDIGLLVECEEF